MPWLSGLALPQLLPHHALALPGAPDLRSRSASSGCQASFPVCGAHLEASRTWDQEYQAQGCSLSYTPGWLLTPDRCPARSPGHRILELTTGPHTSPPPVLPGRDPSTHTAPTGVSGTRVPFPVAQHRGSCSHAPSHDRVALRPPTVILENVPGHLCPLLLSSEVPCCKKS